MGVAANHGDEGEKEQREDQDDLTTGQPEFSFAVRPHGQNVEDANEMF